MVFCIQPLLLSIRFEDQPCCSLSVFFSFLWLDIIPFYGYTTFCLYSQVDGHLDCFHLLVIISNSAMNIHIHASVWMFIFIILEQISKRRFAVLYGKFLFNFFKIVKLFLIVAVLLYVPSSNVQ